MNNAQILAALKSLRSEVNKPYYAPKDALNIVQAQLEMLIDVLSVEQVQIYTSTDDFITSGGR